MGDRSSCVYPGQPKLEWPGKMKSPSKSQFIPAQVLPIPLRPWSSQHVGFEINHQK